MVYDNVITEAFVQTVQKLLCPPKQRSIYVALEKRYVFTIADCDTVAPCYEYFIDCVNKLKNVSIEHVDLSFPKYFEYERVKELVLWKISNKF